MASAYPSALDALSTSHTSGETIQAATDNDQADAINKIEAELGTDPAGTFSTVAARLNARLTCRKTADQNFTSATLANVTDLLLPVGTAGLDYYFKFVVPWSTATSGQGAGFAVTVPALGTGGYIAYTVDIIRSNEAGAGGTPAAPAIGNVQQVGPGTSSGDAVVSEASIQNAVTIARIEGVLSNPSATGNIQLQCRIEVTTATVTVKKGGWGEVYIN